MLKINEKDKNNYKNEMKIPHDRNKKRMERRILIFKMVKKIQSQMQPNMMYTNEDMIQMANFNDIKMETRSFGKTLDFLIKEGCIDFIQSTNNAYTTGWMLK